MVKVVVAVVAVVAAVVVAVEVVAIVRVAGVVAGVSSSSSSSSSSGSGSSSRMSSSSKTKYHFRMCNFEKNLSIVNVKLSKMDFVFCFWKPTETILSQPKRFKHKEIVSLKP